MSFFLAVFLVVFFVALLQNAVLSSPIIFFKLSEDSAGCNDLVFGFSFVQRNIISRCIEQVLTPLLSPSRAAPLVNASLVNTSVANVPLVWGTAPRWVTFVLKYMYALYRYTSFPGDAGVRHSRRASLQCTV